MANTTAARGRLGDEPTALVEGDAVDAADDLFDGHALVDEESELPPDQVPRTTADHEGA